MAPFPRSLDQLHGLRAARWIRESSAGQWDNFGPDAQRDQQDRAIERYGLTDTGIAWQVAHSGRTIGSTGHFREMLAAAGRTYDVLVVGYVSRFARDLRTAVNARHDLHTAGAAILFADERLLSSDEDQWDSWAREAVEAESYSRKLGRRIREGYVAKFNRDYGDQGGTTPLGFRRTPEKPHLLEIDPATIGQAVRLFELYSTGQHSFTSLGAEVGLAPERVREILAAPIFNGWYRRGKRSREEQRKPAPWREHPPISDELWDRVHEVRRAKAHGGGPHRTDRRDPLAGLLYCSCGRHVKANGTNGSGSVRAHPSPCERWGDRVTYPHSTWLEPLSAQVGGMKLDKATIAQVMTVLQQAPPRRDELTRARLARRRKEAAEAFSAGRLGLAEFTARIGLLDAEERAVGSEDEHAAAVSAPAALAYLRDLRRLWADAGVKERADLLHAIYARVEVRGADFVGVTLTPAAEAHGLALALQEEVALARPAGFEPAT